MKHRLSASGLLKPYIGDRAFYASVMAIIVPIVIQSSISNFVNLLDNLMVGSVGEAQMNGVSISNNLIFVYNLAIFGGMSGATIFAAQFFGAGDKKGVRHSFRYSLIVGAVVTGAALIVLTVLRDTLLSLWINPETFDDAQKQAAELLKAEETLAAGRAYLDIMLWGLAPFALTNAYAGILRTTGDTKLPMVASVVSVFTNLVLNYLLIFDHGPFKGLGVKGAAIATVTARYVELAIILFCSHSRVRLGGAYAFLDGAYKRFSIPGKLLKSMFVKGLPLLINELLWSSGMTMLSRIYSLRGLTVVNAYTITSTLVNIFNVLFASMGTAASVMVGRSLGANDIGGAKDNARKIIAFEEMICVGTCIVLLLTANFLPLVYTKSSLEAKALATRLIRICGLVLPLQGFAHCTYFILRSGGKTVITFLFDSVYTWAVPVPLAFLLIKCETLGIVAIYAICSSAEIIKDVLGYILLKKGVWIHNIVSGTED
ncbi:MAG: MATE family efflux transporter [Clostridia bacterium]|nr:MATE family efflux transporter [Clostridia bacterium]